VILPPPAVSRRCEEIHATLLWIIQRLRATAIVYTTGVVPPSSRSARRRPVSSPNRRGRSHGAEKPGQVIDFTRGDSRFLGILADHRDWLGGGDVVARVPVWFVGNAIEVLLDKLFPPGW
jgi:hypothetical protein